MKRTVAAGTRLFAIATVLVLAALPVSRAQAKCGKDCSLQIRTEFMACKAACPMGLPGRPCRMACGATRKADKLACKLATNPMPPDCGVTTTTTTSSTTTTTVGCSRTTTVVQGSLPATLGRFTYNNTAGLPGAAAACTASFPGSHLCTISELQGAPATDLACLKDTTNATVTSFWAIDPNAPGLSQCIDDVGSQLNWEYATAHTASRGETVSLDNATGALGPVQNMIQCNISGDNWVGCCK